MFDISLEIIRSIILFFLLLWLWKQGKTHLSRSNRGWNYILSGFALLLLGSVLDITDNFESLNWLVVVGDTEVEAILEKLVGFLGGFLLLALGLVLWIPSIQKGADEVQQHKNTTEKLAEANLLLQAILDSIPGGVFWKGLDLNYLGANASFARDGGMATPEQLIGLSDFDMPWHEFANHYRADDQQVIDSKTAKLNIIEKITDAKGDDKWLLTNKVPLFKLNGELLGILGTYVDISELKAMEVELLTAKEQAEQANHAKSEFLSSMSHELRTPMNAVLGFAQLLASDKKEPLSEEQQTSLSYIIDNGNHLLELINAVLDLSKVEMNQVDVKMEAINVDKFIAAVVSIMSPEAAKANVSIVVQPNNLTDLAIHADGNKLKQVLLNLSSNAIKYNSDKGTVTFAYQQTEAGKVRIAITDTGKGVATEDFPALFEPFNRLDKAHSAILGTGIGLSISKQLVEAMQGEIGVYNNDEQGLTFWVEFEQVVG